MWGDGDSSRAIEFSFFNMGGYFPMRLLNMALGSIVKKGIAQMVDKMAELQKEIESTGTNTE